MKDHTNTCTRVQVIPSLYGVNFYSFVVTATPEPGSLPLVGMGLVSGAGMVEMVKRRKAKQAD